MMRAMLMFSLFLAASPLSASEVKDAVYSNSPLNGKCKLPEFPANGRYIADIPNTEPGDAFDSVTVNVFCVQGFEVDRSNTIRCRNGSWTEKLPKCIIKCGTLAPEGTDLIINGVPAKRAEVPWHAGIYTRTRRPYKQICGGSLIRNSIVISAARCFWSDKRGKLPAVYYAVAVGKLYRPWIDTRDEAQQSDVKELHMPDHFQGNAANFQDDIAVVIVTDPFEYTVHIRPVCVDFDAAFQESQLMPGRKGKVAGWGLTAENSDPSQVLKVIDLPYITTNKCVSELPGDFHKYITSDKMCAGYKQVGKTVCRGDSGSGLAFPGTKDKDIERYYLRGVVSPHNNNLCNATTYTTFTLLLNHEHFVKHWLDETTTQKKGDRSSARPVNRNVVRTFVDRASSPPAPFQHLTVDRNTGHVYIGALNRIHQLTADLKRTQWVVTGQVEDFANLFSELTENTNKVLVIDYVNSRLITCGSAFQGICSLRNLSNISLDVSEIQENLAGNNVASSTVAFIAPGSPNPPSSLVLYVGTVYSGTWGSSHFNKQQVSSYSLDDFKFASRTEMFRSSREIITFDLNPINYVYGFSSEGFSYFLLATLEKEPFDYRNSLLVRVCHDDAHYHSYTEIPISCTGVSGGKNMTYNFVQAAFVGKAGRTLAAELEISTQQDVLFAVFSSRKSINSNKLSEGSALCIYSLKAIRRKFTQNIKRCFSGIGSRWPGLINVDSNSDPFNVCVAMDLHIGGDFCGLKVNSPLSGQLAMEAVPAAVYETRLTALAVTTIGDHTVLFAGTADGYLKKILVDNSSSAFEYGDIIVDLGSPINKDLIFDTQLAHLYVITERTVSKVRIQECYEYKSCLECLKAKDPFCGWSLFKNECSLRSHGQNATQDTLQWISYSSGRCPSDTDVNKSVRV